MVVKRMSRKAFLRCGLVGGAGLMLPFGGPGFDIGQTRQELGMQSSALKETVRGQLLRPGEDGYDAERAGWNQIVEHHPATIVVAAGAEDVAAAVRYAASEGLPVAVQATGH